MLDALLEGIRILALIVLVWFGLAGWKLIPLFRTQSVHDLKPNCGD